MYPGLSEGKLGLVGAVISRAEAQVMRIAGLYALFDESREIGEEHLRAAMALWTYREQSASHIFGAATGDDLTDRLDRDLNQTPDGLTRKEINNLMGGHVSSETITNALRDLETRGLAKNAIERTTGRPAERWLSINHNAEKADYADKVGYIWMPFHRLPSRRTEVGG